MVIGIDIGGSTTKIVGFDEKDMLIPMTVSASDPLTSASGALGKFMSSNSLELNDIDNIFITGVGSTYIGSELLGFKVQKVDEFHAVGKGGLFMSGLNKAIVVSMGTGTAYVKANKKHITHIGGTGVGGGTLTGLAKIILNVNSFSTIIELAKKGKFSKVDLTIGDISYNEIGSLPTSVTASNFGKLSDHATKNDLAAGIINMVLQTIGMLAIFAAKAENYKDIILTGNLIEIPQSKNTLDELSKLFNVQFTFPKYAQYATAIGAAISEKIE